MSPVMVIKSCLCSLVIATSPPHLCPLSVSSSAGCLLEVKIRRLAEVLDMLLDQMRQRARSPNIDPVIDGTDEAIPLGHKGSTLGINEHEAQEVRIMNTFPQ